MVPNIHLYTAQTPDCNKISITLEELRLPYTIHVIDVSKHEQKEPGFIEINPNGRIPAMTDTLSDGRTVRLFESGSIMQYLVEQISYPKGSSESYEVNNWLFFQTSGIGPSQGQAVHFLRFCPQKIDYALSRYQGEVQRLYRVLETQLTSSKSKFLIGDRCTIADIAIWTWVVGAFWAGVDIEEFPRLKEWEKQMMTRPGVAEGRHKPGGHFMKELEKDLNRQRKIEAEVTLWVQELQRQNMKKAEVIATPGDEKE